jgi:membrane-bound lytic murein transglycosylase B
MTVTTMPVVLFLAIVFLAVSQPVAAPADFMPAQDAAAVAPVSFEEWLEELIVEAQQRGYSDDLVSETLIGLQPLPRVIQNDRSQAEFQPGFSRYLSSRLTSPMIQRGQDLARTHAGLLGRIEEAFGVQRRFLLAIWGLETNYGRVTGNTPVFRALATLAWEPRRAAFFRGELFSALSMVDRGYIEARTMTGSWAGAMGQPQFMPSSYLRYAVDFDGDGRRDIWTSTADTLASMANYLKGHGWDGNYTWGREVRVQSAASARIGNSVTQRTQGCSAVRSMTEPLPLGEWQRLGVRLTDGSALPTADLSASLVEADTRQFLVYPNYEALLGYNCAHFYALTVALLSDRLR